VRRPARGSCPRDDMLPMKAKMKPSCGDELAAMRAIYAIVAPLDDGTQGRVIDWLKRRLMADGRDGWPDELPDEIPF